MKDLAEDLVHRALKEGADESEVTINESSEFSVEVRMGKIENLVEAGSRVVGVRILKDKKTSFVSSSDLSKNTLYKLIRDGVSRAQLGNPDTYAGLPDKMACDIDIDSLRLYDSTIPEIETKDKIELALETEGLALQDKRITNSHGASFETREIESILANSKGFCEGYKETYCGLSVGLQAGQTDSRVEDYWFSASSHFQDLKSPEEIARTAVERTVRQLNARKIKTTIGPVIFEPMMTSWLLAFLFGCISGISVYRKTSFLMDKLGQDIAHSSINVYDDGLMPGKSGTSPFDSEGVPTQRTEVIQKGNLKNFLCNTYAARRLKLNSTGNAEGNGVGPNNFYMGAGSLTPEEIIQSTDRGLLLIRTMGHGLNPVTGDISRGAFGLWIEKGEIVYPVSEIAIAGNLGKILTEIDAIGNDLEFLSSISGPTIRVEKLTISGT